MALVYTGKVNVVWNFPVTSSLWELRCVSVLNLVRFDDTSRPWTAHVVCLLLVLGACAVNYIFGEFSRFDCRDGLSFTSM